MVRPTIIPKSQRTDIAKYIIIAILALLLIFGLIILIIWLIIQPAPITYSVVKADIHNFNISSSNQLNATFDLDIQTNNHNKKISISYDYIEVSVWYSDEMVAMTNFLPFHQPEHNITTIHVSPLAKSFRLTGSAAKKIKWDRTFGLANLEVRVEASVGFQFEKLKSKHYGMKVDCSPVLVHFASGDFKAVDCDVHL